MFSIINEGYNFTWWARLRCLLVFRFIIYTYCQISFYDTTFNSKSTLTTGCCQCFDFVAYKKYRVKHTTQINEKFTNIFVCIFLSLSISNRSYRLDSLEISSHSNVDKTNTMFIYCRIHGVKNFLPYKA